MSAEPAAVTTTETTGTEQSDVGAMIFRVAWMAILLGLAIEIAILVINGFFDDVGGLKTVINDTIQKVSWPFFVCIGIAFGKAASNLRPPGLAPGIMGLAGLLAAPLAFNLARLLHKGAGQALSASTNDPNGFLLFALTGLKAGQYALLAFGLGWVAQKAWGGALAHAGVGLFCGLVFGVTAVVLKAADAPQTPENVKLVTDSINEIIVPVGCALIVFASDAFTRRLGVSR